MSDNAANTSFLLQNLMEYTTDHIYFKDRDSRFLMVNRAFCEWTGLDKDTVVGKTDFDLFASAHAQQAFDDEQRIIQTGKPLIGIEEKETWEDGRITWVSTSKMPLTSKEGEIIGTFGISRNITEHKEAELRAAYYAEQIRRIKEEMEEDVRMAAELQKTFFPRSYPAFPENAPPEGQHVEFLHHYHASGFVSGDFCTIRRLSDTQVGIFLCDVMGHGVRSALVTALICALVEDTAEVEQEPGGFLERMNLLLLPMLKQEDMFLYATACYVVFDTATGLLKFANAGHPVPIHISKAQNAASWLMDNPARRGPALAISEEGGYQTFERSIESGDTILMYTDGLYEVMDAGEREFGEERLLNAAGKHAGSNLAVLFPELLNEARHFSKGGEFDDDICMVGFKYKKPGDAGNGA